jgi:glycosyltransferase involved in cell wall biosynthesis
VNPPTPDSGRTEMDKTSLIEQEPDAVASSQLIFAVETDLTQPVYIGHGLAFPLQGWCYSQLSPIRNLEITVNGVLHRVVAHSRARLDVFNNQSPAFDQSGNSLLSGFYAVLAFTAIRKPERIQLGFRAVLEDNSAVEQPLGALELNPGSGKQPVQANWKSETQRVAICMTTYNPSPGLFRKQIESIQKQTYSNWICIISDDASSAEVRHEIREAIESDDRFILMENELRLGFYRNFERCLQFVPADADFVALSDQDDVWFPDKIQSLLGEFQSDTQLVYSDMQLIDGYDQVLSDTFWITRKNNYQDLPTLFFANTITGAASMFRASLLPLLLPFPERLTDTYHDHWIGLGALMAGNIRFINRPLYAYRQHEANVFGHRNEQPYPGLLHGLTAIVKSARDRVQLQTMGRKILENAIQAYPNVLHKIVLAKTLLLRHTAASPGKKVFLSRMGRLEHSLLPLIYESGRAAVLRRPTLGLEQYHLRVAIGVRLWDMYFRNQKPRLIHTQLQRAQAVVSSAAPTSVVPSTAQGGMAGMNVIRHGNTQWISDNISPLTLQISDQYPRRVNLLIATIDFRYVYGGYLAMFHLALKLKKSGYRTRIILTEKTKYDLEGWRRQADKYADLVHLFDEVEILYRHDRTQPVETNPRDAFIATSCWTAHIAHQAIRKLERERFTFLVQDYEPMFLPMNSVHAIFMQAYTFPQFNLFSTELLREYFRMNHIGVYSGSADEGNSRSISFQNAINRIPVKPEIMKRDRKRLLFYARPEPHAARNMFELGLMSLMELLRSGEFDVTRWTFYGIGSIDLRMDLELGPNVRLKLVPRTSLQAYLEMLPTFDVGMSLMLTPHPSLVPLEMASAGLWTVTNSFANKTGERLQAISSNLIVVPPTIGDLKNGLLHAMRRVDEYDQRIAGAHVNWATDWDEAFNPQVMQTLRGFLNF